VRVRARCADSPAPDARDDVGILVALLILVLVAIVVAVVSGPLRARGTPGRSEAGHERGRDTSEARASAALLIELTSAREAKYQEIRDAELDFRTGKLSRGDYEAVDASLRTEAIEILNRLEAAGGDADGDDA
jgi:hypothetical protein